MTRPLRDRSVYLLPEVERLLWRYARIIAYRYESRAEADDLFIEGWWEIGRRISRVSLLRHGVRSWIYRKMVKYAIGQFRKEETGLTATNSEQNSLIAFCSNEDSPEEVATRQEEIEWLRTCIGEQPEKVRLRLQAWLKTGADLSASKLAGCSHTMIQLTRRSFIQEQKSRLMAKKHTAVP